MDAHERPQKKPVPRLRAVTGFTFSRDRSPAAYAFGYYLPYFIRQDKIRGKDVGIG